MRLRKEHFNSTLLEQVESAYTLRVPKRYFYLFLFGTSSLNDLSFFDFILLRKCPFLRLEDFHIVQITPNSCTLEKFSKAHIQRAEVIRQQHLGNTQPALLVL